MTTNICADWTRHTILVDGKTVVVKIKDDEWLISADPEAAPLITGKLKQMHRDYADLNFGEFLVKMFPHV